MLNAKKKFDKKLALGITNAVSTMNMAYLFAVIALISLPAAVATHQLIVIVGWLAQTFLQLVLLSVIMVAQKIQSETTIDHVNKKHESMKLHVNTKLEKIHKHLGVK